MSRGLLSFILCFFLLTANSQTLKELIELNKENLAKLYRSRGLPAYWVSSGDVDIKDITKTLKEYDSNVGLLMFNHADGVLTTSLIGKNGLLEDSKLLISKDSISKLVENSVLFFSSGKVNSTLNQRGSRSINVHKEELELYYSQACKTLLPFNENLITQFDHLIFIPVLNISAFPFAAIKFKNDSYLIDEMSYSIASSIYEFMVQNEMRNNHGSRQNHKNFKYVFENALFVGNPNFEDNENSNFSRLPGSQKEIEKITAYLDESDYEALIGDNATISNFKENICEYDLLYFATHGLMDSSNVLDNSYLVFARDETGEVLTAREIQNIRHKCMLNADLVVLSACNSGVGLGHEGGIIGIARAFQISGANHVVMSSWEIDDLKTAELMDLFFKNLLNEGELMPHSALRDAVLEFRSQNPDSSNHWAAFSIFGIPY